MNWRISRYVNPPCGRFMGISPMDLHLRTDMRPSIDHIRLSSPKHAGRRTLRLLFQCLRRLKHRALDVSIAPANGSGLPQSSTPQSSRAIHQASPRQKSTLPLPPKNPRCPLPNNSLRPLSFLWIQRRTPRNRKQTPPPPPPGYYFGRKVSNQKARRRRCLYVEVLAGIKRTKWRRRARGQTSRSPGS